MDRGSDFHASHRSACGAALVRPGITHIWTGPRPGNGHRGEALRDAPAAGGAKITAPRGFKDGNTAPEHHRWEADTPPPSDS
ncbi:hypothetical protein GCM10023317_48940 [Actinopolymorpha pittospori]